MDLYNLVVSAKLSKGEGGDVDVDSLSVTENGTYTAQSGHAYNPVTVNVPQSGITPTGNINITSTAQTDVSAYATAQVVDSDLVASNIKKDVNILGVTGTYEGGGGGGSSDLAALIDRSITSLVVPEGVETLGPSVFAGCTELQNITLPSTLKSIGLTAFSGNTKLKKLVVPEGVTTIDNNFCFNATSLEELDLPSTFTTGGNYFMRGTVSTKIICRAINPPTLGSNPFYQGTKGDLYVPAGSVEAYKASNGWGAFDSSHIHAIPE